MNHTNIRTTYIVSDLHLAICLLVTVYCINYIYIFIYTLFTVRTVSVCIYLYALYGAYGECEWGQVYKIIHKIKLPGEGAHR